MLIPEMELVRVFKQIGRISALMGAALCLACLPVPLLVINLLVQEETGKPLWPFVLTPGLFIFQMLLGGGVSLLNWKRQALLQGLRVPGPLPKNFERGLKVGALWPFALALGFLIGYGGDLLYSSPLLLYLSLPLAGLVWYLLYKLVR